MLKEVLHDKCTGGEVRMRPSNRWSVVVPIVVIVILVVLIVAGLQLSASVQKPDTLGKERPAKVDRVEGTDLSRVSLTKRAAERLAINTAPVRAQQVARKRMIGGEVAAVPAAGVKRTVVPYAAVLYDPQGGTWVYTNPEPLVFVRHRISVDYIEGDLAVLSEGPPPDTAVVIVGAAQLSGVEFGLGK